MGGVHSCGREKSLDRSVHEIRSAGSVGVHVNEPWADVIPFTINYFRTGGNAVRDSFDQSVLKDKNTRGDLVRHYYFTVD